MNLWLKERGGHYIGAPHQNVLNNNNKSVSLQFIGQLIPGPRDTGGGCQGGNRDGKSLKQPPVLAKEDGCYKGEVSVMLCSPLGP